VLLKKCLASSLIQGEGKSEESYGNSVVLEFLIYPTFRTLTVTSGLEGDKATLSYAGQNFGKIKKIKNREHCCDSHSTRFDVI